MHRRGIQATMILIAAILTTMCAQSSRTVAGVLVEHEPKAIKAYAEPLSRAKISWPPKKITLIGIKQERALEVWAKGDSGSFVRIARYPILAASGDLGPKRKEGDKQVPEGIYSLPSLNPNSSYHLSIKVGYPNETDISNSKLERNQMGGDIFVHGRSVSIGCIAIGDAAIEELFCLVARVPASNRKIIITPVDFRKMPNYLSHEEEWVQKMYMQIQLELKKYQ